MKNTNKHTGANTGTLIYSERAKRRKKRENRKFYKKYNENCGEVISYKLPKEEIDKLLKNKDWKAKEKKGYSVYNKDREHVFVPCA